MRQRSFIALTVTLLSVIVVAISASNHKLDAAENAKPAKDSLIVQVSSFCILHSAFARLWTQQPRLPHYNQKVFFHFHERASDDG